jgi:nucleotidyltransferase/DNA polymerase involved in DNA repair
VCAGKTSVEAYLDVTENLKGIASATQIAEEIRAKIRNETGLTASAGVSYNKFLAKIASDHRKPDGLFVITPKMGPAFVETLPVGKFHGVGPATTAKMHRLGIETGLELRAQTLPFLQQHFGKSGPYYFWIGRIAPGRWHRCVISAADHPLRQQPRPRACVCLTGKASCRDGHRHFSWKIRNVVKNSSRQQFLGSGLFLVGFICIRRTIPKNREWRTVYGPRRDDSNDYVDGTGEAADFPAAGAA